MAQSKVCDTIVVNELLAFLQNKLDVMDELSLEQICMSSYKEQELLDAKKVLSETANTHIRLGSRTRDGRGKKDLQDIFRVFKETDPDDVPTYVARDLCKLPPVTFDHVDVTRLLKDITSLKSEVALLHKKLEASERITAELRQEVSSSRNVTSELVIPPIPSRNINMRRGGAVQFSPVSENEATPDNELRAQCNDRDTRVVNTSRHEKATQTSQPPSPKESYAKKTSQRCPSTKPAAARAEPSDDTQRQKASISSKVDKDGFTLVENRKSRSRRNRNKRGTAPVSVDVRAAAPTMLLYLSRLDQQTCGEKLLQYIVKKSQSQVGTDGVRILKLTRIESTRITNFKSYTLQIPAMHKSVFLSADFWPAGVVFRRYREARPKPSSLV